LRFSALQQAKRVPCACSTPNHASRVYDIALSATLHHRKVLDKDRTKGKAQLIFFPHDERIEKKRKKKNKTKHRTKEIKDSNYFYSAYCGNFTAGIK
jgi:hypothetical protein